MTSKGLYMSKVQLRQWTAYSSRTDVTEVKVYSEVSREVEQEHVGNSFYRPSFLDREIAGVENGSWVMASVRIPAVPGPDASKSEWVYFKRDVEAMWAWLRMFQPTLAWLNGDSSFVAVKVFDDGVARPWGQLRDMTLLMSGNLAKRFGAFTTWSYMHHTFENVSQVEGPGERLEFWPHELTVRVLPDPADISKVDGQVFMRSDVFEFLREKMDGRIRPFDEQKANLQWAKHSETRVFSFRGLLDGLWKGHVVVCDDLSAPLVAHECNVKGELVNTAGDFPVHLVPHAQGGKVRSNRQTVAFFYESLFAELTPGRDDSEGLLKDSFAGYVERMVLAFEAGRPLPFLRHMTDMSSNMALLDRKIVRWVESGQDLNESMYLTLLQSGAFRRKYASLDDSNRDKKGTSMPAPFAERWSLKNFTTFQFVFPDASRAEPADGEFFTVPGLGMIVNDTTFAVLAKILGGADMDDDGELHMRRLMEDVLATFGAIAAGSIVVPTLRNPVGTSCDVDGNIGVEYALLVPEAAEAARIERVYGELPELWPSKLPLQITELGELSLDFPEVTADVPETYSKRWFADGVVAATGTQGVYGQHVIGRMYHVVYGLPFVAGGREEDFIDATAMTRLPEQLAYIKEKNREERASLDAFLLDAKADGRLKELLNRNPIPELVNFYEEVIDQAMARFYAHVRTVASSLQTLHGSELVYPVAEADLVAGRPVLFDWLERAEKFYCAQQSALLGRRVSRVRSVAQREALGDLVFDTLAGKVERGEMSRDEVFARMTQAWSFALANMQPGREGAQVENLFMHHDSPLMQGRLFSLLCAALEEEVGL